MFRETKFHVFIIINVNKSKCLHFSVALIYIMNNNVLIFYVQLVN